MVDLQEKPSIDPSNLIIIGLTMFTAFLVLGAMIPNPDVPVVSKEPDAYQNLNGEFEFPDEEIEKMAVSDDGDVIAVHTGNELNSDKCVFIMYSSNLSIKGSYGNTGQTDCLPSGLEFTSNGNLAYAMTGIGGQAWVNIAKPDGSGIINTINLNYNLIPAIEDVNNTLWVSNTNTIGNDQLNAYNLTNLNLIDSKNISVPNLDSYKNDTFVVGAWDNQSIIKAEPNKSITFQSFNVKNMDYVNGGDIAVDKNNIYSLTADSNGNSIWRNHNKTSFKVLNKFKESGNPFIYDIDYNNNFITQTDYRKMFIRSKKNNSFVFETNPINGSEATTTTETITAVKLTNDSLIYGTSISTVYKHDMQTNNLDLAIETANNQGFIEKTIAWIKVIYNNFLESTDANTQIILATMLTLFFSGMLGILFKEGIVVNAGLIGFTLIFSLIDGFYPKFVTFIVLGVLVIYIRLNASGEI